MNKLELMAVVGSAVAAAVLMGGCGKKAASPDQAAAPEPVVKPVEGAPLSKAPAELFPAEPQLEAPDVAEGWTVFACETMKGGVAHLKPATSVDFLAERTRMEGQPARVSSEHGEACSTAKDSEQCQESMLSLDAEFVRTDCVQICSEQSFVFTRGDEVGKVAKPEEVVAFLAPIDTPMEAWVVAGDGPLGDMQCDKSWWKAEGDGFLLRGKHMVNACPVTMEEREVRVAADGSTEVVKSAKLPSSGACIGRLPEGVAMPALPTELAAFFQTCGELEASSVWAFERMAGELAAAGAPDELVRRCLAAADDERSHTQEMASLCGHEIRVGPTPLYASRSLEALALENAVEGCVRELVGAAVGAFQAETAAPGIREAMARIAPDELEHAALSFAVHEWLMEQLPADAQARVRLAMTRAVQEVSAAPPAPGLEGTGLPSGPQASQLIAALQPAWRAVMG